MLHVFVLAVCAAFYPTLLAGVIVILGRPSPARQLFAFYIGGATFSIGLGLVILFALGGEVDDSKQAASVGTDIALGLMTLIIAWVVHTGRDERFRQRRRDRRGPKRPKPLAASSRVEQVLNRGSTPVAFAVGVVLNLPGIWYLAALKQIATDNGSNAHDVAMVLVFNAIMFTLVEVPLVGYVFAPQRTAQAVGRFNVWLRTHARQILIGVTAFVGIYLIVKGIIEAVS